jgi:hypothetical protein
MQQGFAGVQGGSQVQRVEPIPSLYRTTEQWLPRVTASAVYQCIEAPEVAIDLVGDVLAIGKGSQVDAGQDQSVMGTGQRNRRLIDQHQIRAPGGGHVRQGLAEIPQGAGNRHNAP